MKAAAMTFKGLLFATVYLLIILHFLVPLYKQKIKREDSF